MDSRTYGEALVAFPCRCLVLVWTCPVLLGIRFRNQGMTKVCLQRWDKAARAHEEVKKEGVGGGGAVTAYLWGR